ncbi:putative reverse transcriptase domain-containing protein [Tanacetum coccineum]
MRLHRPPFRGGHSRGLRSFATIVVQGGGETTIRDRHVHHRLVVMIEREAKMAREAWGLSMDASDYACSDVMSLRTMVVAQSALISELQSADHRRQRVISELLASDHRDRPECTRRALLADCTDLLFCLATQYSYDFMKYYGYYVFLGFKENGTKEKDTRVGLNLRMLHLHSHRHSRPRHPVTNAQIQVLIIQRTLLLHCRHVDANQKNGDDSHTSGTGARRPVQVARECTYPDFLKCQPLNFKGTEGVVGLTQWFEKMESVYSISNCTVACQVKFATCTLQGNALTWWNSHVKTTTPEAAHAMPWRTLKKMMTDKYCPRDKIKKLEFELWNLKVKGTDVVTYSQRFQELALMCDRMFPEEIDQVEKYVGGLPDTIHGSVMATKPKTMQDAIEFATELMDKKINTWAERQADNKRKSDDTARNNQNQQPNKRQNNGRAYAAGNGDRRPYGGPRPLCSKCNYHHDGPWAFQEGLSKIEEQQQLSADRSFVSTAFSSRIVITPTALDHDYNVELADGRIVRLNTIIRGCTLNFLNHPFNIDLMPVELDEEAQRESTEDVLVVHEFLMFSLRLAGISTVRNEGTSGATTRTYGQRLRKTKFLALRSSGFICKEERWVFPDVHRLQGIEQTDNEEPLPTPKDR